MNSINSFSLGNTFSGYTPLLPSRFTNLTLKPSDYSFPLPQNYNYIPSVPNYTPSIPASIRLADFSSPSCRPSSWLETIGIIAIIAGIAMIWPTAYFFMLGSGVGIFTGAVSTVVMVALLILGIKNL